MPSVFDFVRFDETRKAKASKLRQAARDFEAGINELPAGKPKIQALIKIEEAFAWAGKALRDEQVSEAEGES